MAAKGIRLVAIREEEGQWLARHSIPEAEWERFEVLLKFPESIIPLRMVLVTSPPAKTAPANSNIAAITIACFIVMAREPTDVAMALATSFAPIPQVI